MMPLRVATILHARPPIPRLLVHAAPHPRGDRGCLPYSLCWPGPPLHHGRYGTESDVQAVACHGSLKVRLGRYPNLKISSEHVIS